MVKIWDITIPTLTGDETRRAYVYLPVGYKKNKDKHYPVLYMFDGHNVFFDSHATYGKSWGMNAYMQKHRTQMIIAAVECNHSPDGGRLREYAPYSFSDPSIGKIKGLGKKTMDWLVKEFKPYIDAHYRTLPDREHTFIAGSSMGGLMTLYAVLKYNRYFSRGAALSPSVWFGHEKLSKIIQTSKIKEGTVLYMDYGQREMPNHPGMAKYLSDTASQLFDKGILLTCRVVPEGYHCEASWEKQIPFFMETLLYGATDK